MEPAGLLSWTCRLAQAVGKRLSRIISSDSRLNLKKNFLSLYHYLPVFLKNHAATLVRFASPAIIAVLVPLSAGAVETDREFILAGDSEGGAPFVEADPAQPDKVVGFDVDIAHLIARGLGRKAIFLNITFTSIDQAVERGDAEIGLSGIEDTPARRATMAPTVPYY